MPTIRLTRVTVRLYSSFNFPFMFDYSKTNTEKISSLRTDQCLSQGRGGRGGGGGLRVFGVRRILVVMMKFT